MPINEAEILSQLDAEGLGTKTVKVVNDAVVLAIQAASESAIKEARELLINKGTGTLAQSIALMPTEKKGDAYEFEIVGEDYYQFVDKGVDGTEQSHGSPYKFKSQHPSKAHVRAIKEWIPAAGLKLDTTAHPSIKTYDQLSWAVATGVKKHGIKPTNFIDKSFGAEWQKEFANAVSAALGKAVSIVFRNTANKHNNK